MASDPNKPLLRLTPDGPQKRRPGKSASAPRPGAFPNERQQNNIGPKFDRLRQLLDRDASVLELRADPDSLAPERLLVFELRGTVGNFINAIKKVKGLELIDEEDLPADEDKNPVAYLMVPDLRALEEIERLWRRWKQKLSMDKGFTPWRDVFATLRDLRPWGPADRVQPLDSDILSEEIYRRIDTERVALEIELVYRAAPEAAAGSEQLVSDEVTRGGGLVKSRSRITDIAYHALLVELPVRMVRSIIERTQTSIAGLEPVMHIRPQSVASSIDVFDSDVVSPVEMGAVNNEPILALLDGFPIARHPLLSRHVLVEDLFNLEADAIVNERRHGTAMASLVIHGDRNRPEAALPRRIHFIPVMGRADLFPSDRLIVDLVYKAVRAMRHGDIPSARNVIIVNISLGNSRRPFHGQLSAWARLLDRLAHQFGILFLVSAGNVGAEFGVPNFANSIAFEDADNNKRAEGVISALAAIMADRRLLSPAESINALTIGARNQDWVSEADRRLARTIIDPFPTLHGANPTSALGPGFSRSVKPDILMPGGREHLRATSAGAHVFVKPVSAARGAGLKVASPSAVGMESSEGYTNGTSAATALASRTAHRIHDALETAYGDAFLQIPSIQRAVLLKALLVHPASWPPETAETIRKLLGPHGQRQASRQKDNIRRFLGFGIFDAEDAIACAADRATFWAVGTLRRENCVSISVPIPQTFGGKAQPHAISATLAWFTPVAPGRRGYRSVRLTILKPDRIDSLGIKASSDQPDSNQSNRGTVYSQCWSGKKAAIVAAGASFELVIQRQPDTGVPIDEPVSFGLAVSLSMPNVIDIYDQVRERVQDKPQQAI